MPWLKKLLAQTEFEERKRKLIEAAKTTMVITTRQNVLLEGAAGPGRIQGAQT